MSSPFRTTLKTYTHPHPPPLPPANTLDPSLKKITQFTRKLREVTATTLPLLRADLAKLKIERYILEIQSGIEEAKIVNSNYEQVAEIVVVLNWRLNGELVGPITRAFMKAVKGEKVRAKATLKVLAEMYLCGCVPEQEKGNGNGIRKCIPYDILKEMLENDDQHLNEHLATSFAKQYSEEFFDLIPAHMKKSGTITSSTDIIDSPVTPELVKGFRTLFQGYLDTLITRLKKEHKAIQHTKKHHEEYVITRGELSEEMKSNFSAAEKSYERILAASEILCDVFSQPLPELKDVDQLDPSLMDVSFINTADLKSDQEFTSLVWDDIDTMMFYEDITNLADVVPGNFLMTSKKGQKEAAEEIAEREATLNDLLAEPVLDDEPPKSPLIKEDASVSKNIALDNYLRTVSNMLSKNLVDQSAKDFVYLGAGKLGRDKLAAALINVSREQSDQVPYFSRLIATLSPFFPDIRDAVMYELLRDFKRMQYKPTLHIERKTLNVRYIANLILFRQAPPSVAFFIFRQLLYKTWSPIAVEVLCTFLETCGRFVNYIVSEKTDHWSKLLAVFWTKIDSVKHEGGEWEKIGYMAANCKMTLEPPQTFHRVEKIRSPIEIFLRKMIYRDLSKRSVDKILRLIRKVDWNDSDVVRILTKIFLKPEKVQSGSIGLLASLLSGLIRFHDGFCVFIIDGILESIRIDLEDNDKRTAQRRVAQVKYLAELYIFRMIDSPIIFDTLYLLMSFGHGAPLPNPARPSPIDPPDDFFRVYLVTAILSVCGQYFSSGSLRRKLDRFLLHLQFYWETKARPPPEGITNAYLQIIEILRPKWQMAKSLEEAAQCLVASEKDTLLTTEADEEDLPDTFAEVSDIESEDGMKSQESLENEDSFASDDSNDEEVKLLHKLREEHELEEERQQRAEFDKELAAIMNESIEGRKNVASKTLDVTIPMMESSSNGRPSNKAPIFDGKDVEFTVLMKKGHNRALVMPEATGVARRVMEGQAREKEERDQVKKLVINLVEGSDRQGDNNPQDGLRTNINNTINGLERRSWRARGSGSNSRARDK